MSRLCEDHARTASTMQHISSINTPLLSSGLVRHQHQSKVSPRVSPASDIQYYHYHPVYHHSITTNQTSILIQTLQFNTRQYQASLMLSNKDSGCHGRVVHEALQTPTACKQPRRIQIRSELDTQKALQLLKSDGLMMIAINMDWVLWEGGWFAAGSARITIADIIMRACITTRLDGHQSPDMERL